MNFKESLDSYNVLVCGFVDDGKSSLIGKLIHDTNNLYKDQISNLKNDTKKYSNLKNKLDYSLIMDGLKSEREQGITIDIAFNYLEYNKTRFNICDSPGHIQYTQNMAAAASICDAAILLINIKKGITEQTKRHLYLLSFFGLKSVAIIINKIDLVKFSKKNFQDTSYQVNRLLKTLNFDYVEIIPCSATTDVNITSKSSRTAWYKGAILTDFLKKIKNVKKKKSSLYAVIQCVVRNKENKRYYLAKIVDGILREKSSIYIFPSKEKNKIKNLYHGSKIIKKCDYQKPMSFTTIEQSDISRGNIVSSNKNSVNISNQFLAKIFWFSNEKCYSGRVYSLYRSGFLSDAFLVSENKKFNFNSFSYRNTNNIRKFDVGLFKITLTEKLSFTLYNENKYFGSFIIIDKITNDALGVGTIIEKLSNKTRIPQQHISTIKKERVLIKKQKPFVLWFTGISGAGKTTIANIVEMLLVKLKKHTYILDGDDIRGGINKDLKFDVIDRIENIRRVTEIAKLFIDAGIITIVAIISPFKAERKEAKNKFKKNEFFEIFINTSLETAIKRDPKNLYLKTEKGEIKNMTSIDSPYEAPSDPFLEIITEKTSAEEAAMKIISKLKKIKII